MLIKMRFSSTWRMIQMSKRVKMNPMKRRKMISKMTNYKRSQEKMRTKRTMKIRKMRKKLHQLSPKTNLE
jgi:hypothetical protein